MILDKEAIAKCVKISEEYSKRRKEWWASPAGQYRKDQMKYNIEQNGKNVNWHRKKNKFKLTDIETKEETILYGQQAVAEFLGYKTHNSSMNTTIRKNRDKTKTYMIEKEI